MAGSRSGFIATGHSAVKAVPVNPYYWPTRAAERGKIGKPRRFSASRVAIEDFHPPVEDGVLGGEAHPHVGVPATERGARDQKEVVPDHFGDELGSGAPGHLGE